MGQAAVVYLRVSSIGQVNKGADPEGYSIPGQREACLRHAESLGAQVIREYVEPGKSGKTTNRPALQQMLSELAELKPTYVIAYDLSRIARDDFDALWLLREIEARGCKLESTLERVDDTPAGKLLYTVMAGVNAFRSRGDAEKVKMGMKRRHAMGGTNGRAPIGYIHVRKRHLGREIRTVELDPERAPLIQMAFRCYATGEYTISTITEMLDAAGLRSPMTRKFASAPLGRSAVHRMLRDDYYIGVVTHDGAKNPNGEHPPLIDTATFDRVQQVLEAHLLSGDRSQKHEHYLKGSLYCGNCGGRMIYSPVRGHGGRYEYFKCYGRYNRRTNCEMPHVRAQVVEMAVERFYEHYPWLTEQEKDRARAAVRHYAEIKLESAKSEARRAARRLDALKQEQQQLLQLSYRGLVDEDVLAAEQARIKHERAQATKWTEAAKRDTADVGKALEEALKLLNKPGMAYRLASPITRRMMNQALFIRLEIQSDEVAGAATTPWFDALEAVARSPQRRPQRTPETALKAALDRHEARKHQGHASGGRGLNLNQMVPLPGFEPGFPP